VNPSTPPAPHVRLEIERLTLGYGERDVVHELDLVIHPGEVTAIVGPNACGKSTLLRSMTRLLPPRSGRVLFDGKSVHSMPAKQLARRLGLLPQSPIAPEGITVGDLVGRGRHPHQRTLSRWSHADDRAVTSALRATDTLGLVDRAVDELSGGQRQRVWIAMALAQESEILLLDEPTTFLDVSHQVEVLDLLTELNRANGTTIVMVLHDLNLAARYADHLIALREGRLYASGRPSEILEPGLVKDVFGMPSTVIDDPVSGKPLMIPIGRYHVSAG
jgi:iron complex transport system ATP-binding protein